MPGHPSLSIPLPAVGGVGDSESRVLIIYTGGTIGMLVNELGSYAPEPFFLTQTLRAQARFHDPEGASLFSNSGTIANYRRWTANDTTRKSGASTPSNGDSVQKHAATDLMVRSSRPIMNQSVEGTEITKDGYYEGYLPSLVTPRSKAVGGNTKRVRYAVLEWQPLLDSSNMHWLAIATEIELNYSSYDGFIILHGTDTMCYTSSALSFLLEDLGKTVIITGAQIPLSQLRNDGIENLLGALSIAGQYVIPEVCLYFNHTLFRGNRVSKVSSFDLNAFASPNFPPLVNVGIDIVVNWSEVIRSNSMQRFRAHKEMCANVGKYPIVQLTATLRIFPGITTPIVRAFLAPPLQGVVLETFGAGNAPQRPDLLDALREACARGVVIVAISQCAKGSVSAAYDTGRTLAECGVVPGGDMTPECALAKLAYLLSKHDLTPERVRELVSVPLRGELTLPAPLTRPTTTALDSVQDLLGEILRLSQPASAPNAPAHVDPSGTAPWSATASHASATELALLPYLMHLAVARNDPGSVVATSSHPQRTSAPSAHGTPTSEIPQPYQFAQGAPNAPLPGSLHTPLHTAALQGSAQCTRALLEVGALVHVRDALDHTCLFYAARVRAREVVEILVGAGAHLGETDKRVAAGILTTGAGRDEKEIWGLAGLESEANGVN